MIILHAFRKKGQETPRQEIETAERYMSDFLERER
jgi:phage-related protein